MRAGRSWSPGRAASGGLVNGVDTACPGSVLVLLVDRPVDLFGRAEAEADQDRAQQLARVLLFDQRDVQLLLRDALRAQQNLAKAQLAELQLQDAVDVLDGGNALLDHGLAQQHA